MELLEKHFDIAFAAPNGIKMLRELVLTLAMQGKLVPQDPSDQPASALLKEIDAEKRQLLNHGKNKAGLSEDISSIKSEEMPYELPEGWMWVRLGQVVEVLDSLRKPVTKHDRDPGPYPYYGASGIVDFVSNFIFDEPLVLVGEDGAKWGRGENTAFAIAGKTWVNNHAHVLRPFRCALIDQFIVYALVGMDLQPFITGMTVPKLNQARLISIALPLPPIAEQRRIVEKIDILMVRCDELEKLRYEGDQKRINVHTSAMNKLLSSQDHNIFTDACQFFSDHFGELYAVKENVAELRKAILQLAVMGKLVPQDPKEQPASKLLEDINVEKKRLVKEGKIKITKPLSELTDEEKQFNLPIGWVWSRLQDVLDVRDGTHDSPRDASGPETYPLVTSKNFVNGKIDFSDTRQISAEDHFEIVKRSRVDMFDILFSMIGGNIGNQVIVDEDREFSIKNVALFKYYSKDLTYPYFIKRFMEHLALDLQSKAAGGAQPFVSLGFLRNLVIALPPKNEQRRIVVKVDQLMTLCDELDRQIDASTQKQNTLLSAVMAQV
jgi:type I restriction enzyme S subunit